jgi:cytochrome c oxidase subunit 2
MKTKKRLGSMSVLGLALLMPMLSLAGGAPKRAGDADARVIDITAKRFAFSPDVINLKKGETVRIRLHSEDVTHGFFMRALKIDSEIEPGKVTEIVLTPQAAGTFTTICDHFCGVNHGNMKMTIVVE